MKACCRTGDEEPKSKWSRALRWIITATVIALLLIVLLNQLN